MQSITWSIEHDGRHDKLTACTFLLIRFAPHFLFLEEPHEHARCGVHNWVFISVHVKPEPEQLQSSPPIGYIFRQPFFPKGSTVIPVLDPI